MMSSQNNTRFRPKTLTRSMLAPALALSLVAASSGLHASLPVTPQVVGEVTLAIGKAYIRSADGSRELIKKGTLIGVSDSIETASNAHVHVRFTDNAYVSVRPSSRLEIVKYDFNPQNPAASSVKLNLHEGVARSISGKAAHEAKDKFRLNTPIAAIGVRGTDFVVFASSQSVRALVNEGAIIVAPFSSSCSADTFGPCSINALELVGGDSQIVELNANALEPVFITTPAAPIPETFLEQPALPQLAESVQPESEGDSSSRGIYKDSVTSLAVNQTIADSHQVVAPEPPVKPPVEPVIEPPLVTEPDPPPVLLAEFTPDVVLSADELTGNNQQLVWGRFGFGLETLENERITVGYKTAAADGREITIGDSADRYGLFRFEEGSKAVKPGLGVLDFDLTQAQVTLKTADGRELMDVFGGLLNINFNESQFSTSLQLEHAATGKIEFSDSGRVFSSGIFRNLSEEKNTRGVLSIDGSEAGYAFDTITDAGKIEGITLWGVKP